MTAEEDERFCELMKKSQSGHEESYRLLLLEASKHLEAYYHRRLFDSSMVMDLVQETLISVHKSRHTFSHNVKFSPWFFAIAHYRLVDFIRKNKRAKFHVPLADIENDINENELENWDTNKDVVFELEETLKLLNERERNILLLVKVEGLSIKETSEKMGLSEANIKVIVHRSIKKIKERINGLQHEKD